MLIDCHIHLNAHYTHKDEFIKKLDAAGVDKGILLSHMPASFVADKDKNAPGKRALTPNEALENLMEWAAYSDRIVPFFWIDPLDDDAFEQVDRAAAAGVAGFKVICNRFYPYDKRPMDVFHHIAKANKPLLFHSGIFYGIGPSSKYNRPAFFESLLDIPNLRFAMAHVSWPWHDECIAVYGYWRHRLEAGTTTAEMFIDTTPGTPEIYRNEVIAKLYTVGYDIEDNIIFGVDSGNDYNAEYCRRILEIDKTALDAAAVTAMQREKYYYKNVLRFIG